MQVNIDRVLSILEELNEINEAKIEKIQWFKDGKELIVNQEMIDEYEFVGLNNIGFITHEYYINKDSKMSEETTHIICILDRSGSMSHQAPEVITNFNNFLKEQQSLEGKATMTLALFDDKYELLYDELPLNEVPPLNCDTYFTRGMTAMNDAIGKTLNTMQRKDKAIVLIHTDGAENASREYTYETVKTLVDKLKDKWEFIFVGGDIDAKAVSAGLGIMRSMDVHNDEVGSAATYAAFADTTSAYRGGGLEASQKINLEQS